MADESTEDRTEERDLPFPLETLRGRLVHCTGCGEPILVFRRRRVYPLRASVEETPRGTVLVCWRCGGRHEVRELLALHGRVRRPSTQRRDGA
ncbi:MAG: hypothetical protein NZL87_09405 [Thermomicrobium sp.]|nr:hypothetical protein [Thermomicrobium sp.]MDW7982030.1 hypothetical protein [Thermomicrobium sp.]